MRLGLRAVVVAVLAAGCAVRKGVARSVEDMAQDEDTSRFQVLSLTSSPVHPSQAKQK